MRLSLQRFQLTKAVPLAISRGTTAAAEHLLVSLEHDGLTGIGETGGFDTGHRHYDTDAVAAELEAVAPQLAALAPEPLQALEPLLAALSPPARCGLDLALHDWWGKKVEPAAAPALGPGSRRLCRHQRHPWLRYARGCPGAARALVAAVAYYPHQAQAGQPAGIAHDLPLLEGVAESQ